MIIRAVRAFVAFWWDFIVGDDPALAVAVIAALAVTAGVARGAAAWLVAPAIVLAALTGSALLAARAAARDK